MWSATRCAEGPGHAECGDGTCDDGETAASCPEDCLSGSCGNGVIDDGEQCDGLDLAGMSCLSLGAGEGTLVCNSECQFDVSGCEGSCIDQCTTTGETRCAGNILEECRAAGDGCRAWAELEDCVDSQQVCDDASGLAECSDTCTDACTASTERCSGNLVQTCQTGANGCLQWQDETDCVDLGQMCYEESGDAACAPACHDQCTANDTGCLGDTQQTCVLSPQGCLAWESTEDCTLTGKFCDAGRCECPDVCQSGDTRCSGNTIQDCLIDPHGCHKWFDGTDCAATSEVCNESGGQAECSPDCTDACSTGQTQCVGTVVQNCQTVASGCLGWVDGQDCASTSQQCESGACACDHECDIGDRSCLFVHVSYTCETDANGCRYFAEDQLCLILGKICLGGYCVDPP